MVKVVKDRNSLKNRCHVVTQEDDDIFVGIKVEVDNVVVNFPLGFQIAETDSEIRMDILNLLNILNEFKNKQEGVVATNNEESSNIVEFPLNAYLEIISYYMQYGYYMESNPTYKIRTNGKVNWPKTIKRIRPLLQENDDGSYSPIYLEYVVKEVTPNINSEIYYIHRHCVYESFKKLGWLFTSYIPPKPNGIIDKEKFLPILYNKLSTTFNDSEKKLFQAMIDMIERVDTSDNQRQYYFGTEDFAHVWEDLIDVAFGILNKADYYPRAEWNLPQGRINSDLKSPLRPDTIMIYQDKVYVIDAKYYKYGYTNNPFHLPGSVDVNKQITYAEFVKNNKGVEAENIYNVFLMPFDKDGELLNSDDVYLNIGEVTGDWKTNESKYEHVQGILVDVKYLMDNYKRNKSSKILHLAKFIEETYGEDNQKVNEY